MVGYGCLQAVTFRCQKYHRQVQEKYDEIFQDGNEVAQMSIRFAD